MNLEEMKELFESGDYVCYFHSDNKWHKAGRDLNFWEYLERKEVTNVYIHKKHEQIAQAVCENPDVKVEFCNVDTQGQWVEFENFFDSYNENDEYQLKEQKSDYNGYYISASKEAYDLLIEAGYKDSDTNGLEGSKYFGVLSDNKIYRYKTHADVFNARLMQCYIVNGKLSKEKQMEDWTDKVISSAEKAYNTISIKSEDGTEYKFEKPEFEMRVSNLFKDNSVAVEITVGLKGVSIVKHILCWLDLTNGCITGYEYNLTPIKKAWYEDESNFPAFVYQRGYDVYRKVYRYLKKEDGLSIFKNASGEGEESWVPVDECILAKAEQIESLYYEGK